MLEEAFALPVAEDRDYLLAGLARVVGLRGHEQLLAAPLLLPEPRFWPDPVAQRGQGAAILLRRLLAYAGLGDLGVDIEIGPGRDPELVDEEHEQADARHAAGWFLGIEGGICYFGLSNSTLYDEEALIGTLGHEVAHAYREHHGLIVASRDTEEKLTDLTTIYLGFGFFTLQSSFQFKTGHYDDRGQRLLYERRMLGYLSPGQLALLLAAQLLVRRDGKRELAEILRQLAPNHANNVKLAFAQLSASKSELVASLRLPPEEIWPEPRDLEELLRPLTPATVRVVDRVAEERASNAERAIAFRVSGSMALVGMMAGAIAGLLSLMIEDIGGFFWVITLGLASVGFAVGKRIPTSHCSRCHHRVAQQEDTCGFCSTPLVGSITSLADGTEAEERYWAERDAEDFSPLGGEESFDPVNEGSQQDPLE